MASTSINIQPCKIGSSEEHNYRLKALDYVRPELSHKNESWQSDERTLSQHLDAVRTLVKEKTGRKLQDKATPIREGVIVIKEDTTLADLKRFADICTERWGIKPLQIHTHKDEGHMNATEWKPNLHAHIVFLWVDETTGKSIKMNSQHMAEMQTLLAETLEMSRGVSSDKKHLSSLQFKTEAETKRLGDIETLKAEIKSAVEAQIKPIETLLIENTSKTMFGGQKTDYEAVVGEIQKQEQAKALVKTSETRIQSQTIEQLRRKLEIAEKMIKFTQEEVSRLKYQHKQELDGIDEDFVRFIYKHPVIRDDEGFQNLARSVEAYHYNPAYDKLRERTGRVSFSAMVRMWYEKAVIAVKDIVLSSGRLGDLLLNGLTPSQFLKQETQEIQEGQKLISRGR